MTPPGGSIHRPLCPDGRAAEAIECKSPCEAHARPFVLAATILASAMAFIDGSIVTIALPIVQQDLDASFATLQWVVNAYALLLGGLILNGGAAGDRFGRRRVFVAGLSLFAAASVGCAAAPNIEVLIAARALKGAGAALLVPQSLAIIAAAFPKDVRGRAIGIWAGASAITTAIGPALGGILIDLFDWRAIFWINVPLSAAALWLTIRFVPESRDEEATGAIDWLGGGLAVLACALVTLGLTVMAEFENSGWLPAALLAAGLACLLLFLRVEARAVSPLMPLSLFDNRIFSGANAMTLFLYGALIAVLFLLPFDLIERRGLSATQVGLTLLPMGLVIGSLSRIAGAWADRAGPKPALVLGSLTVTVAAAALALNIESFWIGVLIPIVVISLGMAMVVAPLTTAVMNAAPDTQAGAASGVNNAASRLAGLFAVAIIATVASQVFVRSLGEAEGPLRFGQLPDPGAAGFDTQLAAFASAYSIAMLVAASWSLLAAAIALTMLPSRGSKAVEVA